ITVNFDLSNLTLAEDSTLKPTAQSGEAWQGLDFQIITAIDANGTAQTQTQNVSFGDGFSGSIYIPEGARKGIVYVNAPDDERAEGDQRIQLTLNGVTNADASRYQVTGASGAIAIVDTDRPGVEMLSLKSSYTYNPETDRNENTTQLEPVKQIIVREADDGAMTLRFNLDDLRWDGQNYNSAKITITDTAGLALSETTLTLTDDQRFAVTTVQGDFDGKILNGNLTLDGVTQSFSLELAANQELADAETLRLSPESADLKLTFEQGRLLANEGNALPIRVRQSSWNEYVYVQLTSAPIDGDGQVAVDLKATRSIVGSDEVTLSTNRLTFTAADWNQPRLVGVRGVNDGFNDPNQLGQITATIVTDPAQTTDVAYQFGGQRANLTYLNLAIAEPPAELNNEELVKIYQPANPANPTYGFEADPQTRQLTISEGETAQVTVTANTSGQSGPLVGRYKVVETGLQRSLQLQGGSDHLALEAPIDMGSRFTLQLGFRWSGNRDEGQPVQLVQGVNGHGNLAIATDGRLVAQFLNGQGQSVTVQSTVPLKANEAYQINLVSDGVSAQIYADGRLIGSGSLGTTTIAPVTVTALFGAADVGSVDSFRGVVYGARFWNRDLSQSDIRRFSQEVFNTPPLIFTLDSANSQVLFRLNPDLITEAPTAPIELTFRRYSYTGGSEPAIATVTVTVNANNWQSLLTVPFTFGTSSDLLADISQITVQLSSQSDQVQTYSSNVGLAYELESLRQQHLIDEISPTDLSRFGRRPNFAEGGAIQGQDFEALEGVVVNKGASTKLPISGDRYLGDRPAVVTGDLTGDGKADLLILTEKAGAQFYENTSTKPGDPAFTPQNIYQPNVNTAGLAPGFSGSEARLVDADGDGDLDLVWSQDGGLKVRLNQVENGVAFAGDPVVVDLEDQTGSTLGSGLPKTLVSFDFADINQDGVLDAVVLDQNNRIQAYLGNGAFTLMTGLVRLADEANPFRSIVLPSDTPLSLKLGDVVVDGQPELFVYERAGGDESYWRAFLPEFDGSGGLSYRDRTYVDPLSSRAGQIGDLESLAFLNDSGVDSVFLSLDNGHYRFGTIAQKSNEVIFDPSNPQAVLEVVSRQDNLVELDERVRLQLLSTEDLTARPGLDRTVDVLIQDDDRPGVTLAYVASNGQPASVVASHLALSANPARPLAEGQQSGGFYVLQLNSQPQDNVSLVLRNSDSDRLQFERIYPFALTVNANGSLTVESRLANAASDYSLRFSSPLVQSVSRDGQGAYTVQMTGATATALQGAIAGKSVAEIQQSVTVQNILKQVGIRVDGDDATYRVGAGLNANQLLQERVSITPQAQMKLTILPSSWDQQILLRPVAPENLVDNGQDPTPRLSIAVDSNDAVYGNLPGLLAELPIADNDQAGVIINQLADIREGIDGGQFQVSLRSKPTGPVLITLRPGDLAGNDSSALALDKKYYGDTVELKFTQYNWNAPQTVTVRAQDDNAVTGDVQSYVHATVRSDDPLYAGMAVTPVTVTVRDNDLPSVSAYTVLDASEPGQIGFFGLRLNTDQVRNPEGLKIHYRVKGWASAPATANDYQEYVNLTPEGENFLYIAPGQDIGNVVIFPIDDYIAEGFDLTFKASGVDLAGDRITLPIHRLIDGAKVVFTSESSEGEVPEGLSDDSFYYVKVIDADTIELYSDSARTQKVNLTSGGIGETRLLDATGKATVEEAKENTKRFEAVELELLSDPNGSSPGYQLAAIDTKASVRIYDNENVGFRFILPGQQVLDSSSPADKGYLTIAEHPDIDNTEEFSSAVFLVRPLSDPGTVQTGANAGQDNWVSLRFNPRWDQNIAQEMQVHLAEEPKFEDDGTQTVTIAVYDQYGRKLHFYQRDPEVDDSASDQLTDALEVSVTKETWAEPIRLKSAVFFDVNGNGELDAGEHSGVALSDSRFYFGDDLSALSVGTDLANFNVTLDSFDINQDGYLSLFETTLRPDQPAGWGVVSELANAAAIVVQVGDSIGKVAIPGNTDVAVDRWNRFAVFTSFASDEADTEIKLVAEDGVKPETLLPPDYANDPYAQNDLWKQNSAYFDSNTWTRFQRVKLTALDDKTYDIDRILPLEMKVYEAEGIDGFYSKKFSNAPSPLVLTVKDRRLDNETVTGSLANGFSKLEEIINNYSLPLVGSLSGKLPPFLTDFIRAFSRNLEQQRYITGPSLASALSDALNEQLDGTGVEVSIEYDADAQTISMSLAFGQDYDLFEIGLDSNLGLPALGLETEGSLASIFHFDMRVGIALNLSDRTFTLDISEDETGATNTGADANIYLDLNNFKATGNIAFLRAELEQIPLDDFINGHKPQVTIWLDEDPKVGQTEQTVTVRAYDIGGNVIDLDLSSGNTFASYAKTEDNWKHPLILEGLDYDAIDEISVEFNGTTRRFRVDWTGEKDIQGLKIDARLFTQDPHAFFQEYDGEKDILGALEKDAESESLLSKGDTHSEAALGVGFSLVGKKTVDVEIERKYAFAIETETQAQAIPTLYNGDKAAGENALADFLDDKGAQDGSLSITLEDIDNTSDAINLFTVELFKLVDPNREAFSPDAKNDPQFFPGLKLEPINFTLGAATVDPDDPQPQDPRLPLRRQLTTGGSNNSVLLRDVNGYAIDFSTGGEAGNIETGSDVIFRITKAQTSDGLPSGTFYYVQPFNEDKAIHQVVDYLVVTGPEPATTGASPLEISITDPDAADNANKDELPNLFIIQGDNVKITGAQTQGSLTRLVLDNAEGFVVKTGTGASAAEDTYALSEAGVPIREAEVSISELSSQAKELFDYTASGSLGVAFNLVTSVAGKTSFPSLSLDLGVVAQAEKSKGEDFDLSLAIGLKDLGLDLGSFITKFAAPVIEAVDSVFEPIKPFVEALNQDTQFLEFIGLESQFDKDANDEVSVIELALVLSQISKQRGEAKYAEFFETVVKVLDFIKTVEELAAKLEKGDNLVIPMLDEYHLLLTPGGETAENSTDLPAEATETSTIEHQATKPELPGTEGIGAQAAQSGNENASFFKKLVDKIQAIEGLRFPILEDPVSLVNLLFGKDVNLVLYEVPDLKLELNPRIEFRPFPPFPVKGVLEGRFEVGAQLGFGYDTYGFRQWSEADFSLAESYQVFDGFFLTDWTLDSYLSSTESGIDDKPELYATAEVEAGVEVGEGLTGYLGVGVGANVNFDLEDKGEYQDNLGSSDGKVRGSEIIAGISDPLSLFELYGRIYAFLKALVEVDLGLFSFTIFEQKWEFDLFKFQVGGAKQSGSAVQSEVVGATVFFDANFNLKFDEGEVWGTTLGDGSYSFGIDPAEFDIDGDGKLTLMDGQIIVIGGRDLQSGLPIINPMIASPESGIVSPLTTLATQIAVSNGGDLEASTGVVKDFFNLPASLDLGTFHPIEAIRSGSTDAALGLQVYKSHIIVDTLVYNLSRVAGGYSPQGITADGVINVLDFVAEKLRTAVLDSSDTFEERLSEFVESVVADFYQQEILPTLSGNALNEAQIEQSTIVKVLADTYDRVASAAT
ncbi:MAG: LamG domain-containing protein, partial [Nodosilinea sp.]